MSNSAPNKVDHKIITRTKNNEVALLLKVKVVAVTRATLDKHVSKFTSLTWHHCEVSRHLTAVLASVTENPKVGPQK